LLAPRPLGEKHVHAYAIHGLVPKSCLEGGVEVIFRYLLIYVRAFRNLPLWGST